MLRGKAPLGFTIIETLIFLAVSGFIFISAAALLNGRASQTQFESGVKEIFANLQSLSSNVQNGFYSDISHVPCTGSNIPGTPPSFTGASQQGQNLGCIFVGNAIQFSPNINGVDKNNDYIVYTVAGNEYDTNAGPGDLSTTLTEATPTLLTCQSCSPTTDAQVVAMPDGITVSHSTTAPLNPGVYYESNGSSPQYTTTFGFFTNFSYATGASPDSLESGSLGVALVPIPTSTNNDQYNDRVDNTTTAVQTSINNLCNGAGGSCSNTCVNSTYICKLNQPSGTPTQENPSQGITICLVGDTHQFATITIGENNNPTGMELSFTNSCPTS